MDAGQSPPVEVEAPSIAAPGIKIEQFGPDHTESWDELVGNSCNGTFSVTRKYLSYHRDRFTDRSLLFFDQKGKLRGVLAAAVDPGDSDCVTSHPGNTYGGLIHDGTLRGEATIEALSLAGSHYRELGHKRFVYRPVPSIFHRYLSGDDSYALFRLGAARTSCNLSAVIDLHHRMRPQRMRMKRLRRAEKLGISHEWGWGPIDEFWSILTANLQSRYGAAPTHSIDEINEIHRLFPEQVRLVIVRNGEEAISGGIAYLVNSALHLQYSSSSEEGKESGGLDVVVEASVALAQELGLDHYSFGNSNEQRGLVLNQSLYAFKLSFGAGSVPFEEFTLEL